MKDKRLGLVGDLTWLSPFSKMVDRRRPAGVEIRLGSGSSSVNLDLFSLEKKEAMSDITAPNQVPVPGNSTWSELTKLLGVCRSEMVKDTMKGMRHS